MHDVHEHMKIDNPEFVGAIRNGTVRAIFAGHIHDWVGRGPHQVQRQDVKLEEVVVGAMKIPVFRTGSSLAMTFLVAEFTPVRIAVAEVRANGGTPVLWTVSPFEVPLPIAPKR